MWYPPELHPASWCLHPTIAGARGWRCHLVFVRDLVERYIPRGSNGIKGLAQFSEGCLGPIPAPALVYADENIAGAESCR